jgi:hypothetical protein
MILEKKRDLKLIDEVVPPELENEQCPELLVMAGFSRFVLFDQPLNVFALKNTLIIESFGRKLVIQKRIQPSF